MKQFIEYAAVGAAGFAGAVSRLALTRFCAWTLGTGFPFGTMLINVGGSFLLGWLYTIITDRSVMSATMRLTIGVGFLGAFTTFSSLMYESHALAADGAWQKSVFNLLGSLLLGMIAVWLGVALGVRMTR